MTKKQNNDEAAAMTRKTKQHLATNRVGMIVVAMLLVGVGGLAYEFARQPELKKDVMSAKSQQQPIAGARAGVAAPYGDGHQSEVTASAAKSCPVGEAGSGEECGYGFCVLGFINAVMAHGKNLAVGLFSGVKPTLVAMTDSCPLIPKQ